MGFRLYLLNFGLVKRLIFLNDLVRLFQNFLFQTYKHGLDFFDGLFDSLLENEFSVVEAFLVEFDVLDFLGGFKVK